MRLNKYMDENSPFYAKLIELYNKNESYPKKVIAGRNLHHKKLRSWSKHDKEEIDNSDENLVSLSAADHVLAHYYIWKCAITPYKASAAHSWFFMSKVLVRYGINENTIEELINNYQQEIETAYKEYCYNNSIIKKGKKPKNFEYALKRAHEENHARAQTPEAIARRLEKYNESLEKRKEERLQTSKLLLLKCIEFDEVHQVSTWRKYEVRADIKEKNLSEKGLHFEYVFELKKDFVETELSEDLQKYLRDFHNSSFHWIGKVCDCCGDPDVAKSSHKKFLDNKWHLCYRCYKVVSELREMTPSEFESLCEPYKNIYMRFIID